MKTLSIHTYAFLFIAALFNLPSESSAQWRQSNGPDGESIKTVHTIINYLDEHGSINFMAGTSSGIFQSTTNGATWVHAISNYAYDVYALGVWDTCFTYGIVGGISFSTDRTKTWQSINMASGNDVTSIALTHDVKGGTNLFVGTTYNSKEQMGGVYLSTDLASSWKPINTGLTHATVNVLSVAGANLFAGTIRGAFVSSDNGSTWNAINGMPVTSVNALTVSPNDVSGSTLYAGTSSGVFVSTNSGIAWTAINTGLPNYVNAIAIKGSMLFAGTTVGVYCSSNNGESWTDASSGMPFPIVLTLSIAGTDLLAGTKNGGIWKRPLSEMVTAVEKTSPERPIQFSLFQNYPNPFNPSTTISFSLPSRAFVTLKIFDVMGRDVSTVVSEEMAAGNYTRSWNASGFSSGIYFYRLQAGTLTETKRLILMR
jgi:hypothetical protein